VSENPLGYFAVCGRLIFLRFGGCIIRVLKGAGGDSGKSALPHAFHYCRFFQIYRQYHIAGKSIYPKRTDSGNKKTLYPVNLKKHLF
jgi:hypothetical protein